jgi:hypothetical protein
MQMRVCNDGGVFGSAAPTKSPQVDLGELSSYDASHDCCTCARSSVG